MFRSADFSTTCHDLHFVLARVFKDCFHVKYWSLYISYGFISHSHLLRCENILIHPYIHQFFLQSSKWTFSNFVSYFIYKRHFISFISFIYFILFAFLLPFLFWISKHSLRLVTGFEIWHLTYTCLIVCIYMCVCVSMYIS